VAKQAQQAENEKGFIPDSVTDLFSEIGGIASFAGKFFAGVFFPPYELGETARQSYETGVKTFGIVTITGFIMGLVLTIQSRPTLAEFGAESMLPAMVSISIVREIGPVITALIFAGKVGSGIGAELGSMRVTEQIDAMEVSGTNPFKFLVISRIMATTLMVPILVFYADAVALLGCFIGVNIQGDVSFPLFISAALSAIDFSDLLPATIKTFFFGFAVGLVGSYKGFTAQNGTEGVGRAANTAVVSASLLIFIIDLIAVQITDLFFT
jgi:phospholipid/cholesterol/gamma-HCH transport system permease protein